MMRNIDTHNKCSAEELQKTLADIDSRLAFRTMTQSERDLLTLAANNIERAITAMLQAQRYISNNWK